MQRFGFRASHLQLTLAYRRLTGKSLWLVVPSGVSATHVDPAQHTGQWSSANTFVQLGSQSSGREQSSAAKRQIGRATGFANLSAKDPDGLLGRHQFQLHELDAVRQFEECHQEPSSQDCWEKDLSSFWRLSETGPTSSVWRLSTSLARSSRCLAGVSPSGLKAVILRPGAARGADGRSPLPPLSRPKAPRSLGSRSCGLSGISASSGTGERPPRGRLASGLLRP